MKFWVFDPPMMVGRWAFAELIDPVYGDAPRCPHCGKFIGMKPWLPPYRASLSAGTKASVPADVITGPGFTGFIAIDRFVADFERSRLRGIDRWESAELVGWNSTSYFYGVLPVPTAHADFSQMHPVFLDEPPTCPICRGATLDSYSGVVVDERSWSGDDIFLLMNIGLLMTTERFVDLVAAGEYTGFDLVPAGEYVPSYARRNTSKN